VKFLHRWRTRSRYEKVLFLLFVVTMPLVNPWVRGDGVGYYAYVRSLLIDGDLRFENEWLAANPSFVMSRVDEAGRLRPDQYTQTGYVGNHFTVGPALLWFPFLILAHGIVLALNQIGVVIPADGYSSPYVGTMALATAFYGFLSLWLAFRLARSYFQEQWAFWGTLGIWFASSLPVYMYFNPSWSHAHSAFAVAVFLWYWHRTRGRNGGLERRTPAQWALLGLLSGLMVNVYYPNAVFILVPFLESLRGYWCTWTHKEGRDWPNRLSRLFGSNTLYLMAFLIALLPTLVTRWILYGSPFQLGYGSLKGWNWTSPALWQVLFSANHGLLSWTPVLIPALVGLFLLKRHDRELALYCGLSFLAFYYVISSYPVWHGISSFGNRFFVSNTPIFVLGLAASLDTLRGLMQNWSGKIRMWVPKAAIMVLIGWNLGFIFQWGANLIPNRGPISWREVVYNQVVVVPGKLWSTALGYVRARGGLMEQIEEQDIREMQNPQSRQGK